jgi:hypothetical protein
MGAASTTCLSAFDTFAAPTTRSLVRRPRRSHADEAYRAYAIEPVRVDVFHEFLGAHETNGN